MQSNQRKLGIARVGLGKYSAGQLAPALKETKHCYLAGIVTGVCKRRKKGSAIMKFHHKMFSPVYAYGGLKGRSHEEDLKLPNVNQQALQMDDFAICVRDQKQTKVPGEMGIRDVKILMAIYQAAATGKNVKFNL